MGQSEKKDRIRNEVENICLATGGKNEKCISIFVIGYLL